MLYLDHSRETTHPWHTATFRFHQSLTISQEVHSKKETNWKNGQKINLKTLSK